VIVEGVKKEDEGKYTCHVQNRFASQEVSAFLTVTGIGQSLLYPHRHTLEKRNNNTGNNNNNKLITRKHSESSHLREDFHVLFLAVYRNGSSK